MDLIPDIPIPTQNKLIPDPILTPAKSGINTALLETYELNFCMFFVVSRMSCPTLRKRMIKTAWLTRRESGGISFINLYTNHETINSRYKEIMFKNTIYKIMYSFSAFWATFGCLQLQAAIPPFSALPAVLPARPA